MDVKCERCNTEYEFDDALVSGRGTTVKCTNCGHKFKIRRADADFSEDFWNVTTQDNRTLVFTSLRELQRAIQTHLVERTDRLSRGGLPPKAIGQIPELAPFFDQRDQKKGMLPNARSNRETQDGLGPSAAQAKVKSKPPPPIPGAGSNALSAPPRLRQATKPEFPPPPAPLEASPGKSTLIGTGPLPGELDAVPAAPPMRARMASVPPPATEREVEPDTTRFAQGALPAPSVVGDADVMSLPASAVAVPEPAPPPAPPRRLNQTVPLAPAISPPPPAPQPSQAPPLPDRARRPTPQPMPTPPLPPPTPASNPPARESDGFAADRRSSDRMQVARESAPRIEMSSPLPPLVPSGTPPRMRSLLSDVDEHSERMRGPSASLPDGPVSAPKRRSVGGFIVAAVVIGCVLMLGAVWAQKNLGVTLGAKPVASTPATDPKVVPLLTTGEKALTEGDLDQAKESFDKASVLAEKDPRVLIDLARLAAVRADIVWLKSRLLPTDATDEHRITRDGLSDLAAKARKAADDAMGVAGEDPAAIRAKIDALRISGDRDGARHLVAKISPSAATQPESAYVLAALDLVDVEPLWSSVLERLRTASGIEAGPGRARAALVYALARSGDVPGAKAELERLAAMSKAHPLLPLLRSFIERSKATKLDGGVEGGAIALALDGGPAGPALAANGLPADPRELIRQGEKARQRGDLDKARILFSAALDKRPNDSEALAGLAAISYAQHDLSGARASYKRVLQDNPNYMPALIGIADVDWDSGDRANAIKTYKEIVDKYPEGTYPPRIKQRIEAGGGG